MAEGVDGMVVLGLEDQARQWLPAHVLDEPSDLEVDHLQSQRQQYRHHRSTSLQEKAPAALLQNYNHSFTKAGGRKLRHKQRFPSNRARGGPGMQAVFLDSGQKSCGTGFFLPRPPGQATNRKTGCSPVLLPCRVVQALNLDVRSLGTPLSPQRSEVAEKDSNDVVELSNTNNLKEFTLEKRLQKPADVLWKSDGASPEIFLPKEWTY